MKLAYRLLIFASIVPLLTSPFARATYENVVTWSDMSDLDLSHVLKTPYASQTNLFDQTVTESQLEVALQDADQKISPEFRVPPSMRIPLSFG